MDPEGQTLSFSGPTGPTTIPFKGLRGEGVECSFFLFRE